MKTRRHRFTTTAILMAIGLMGLNVSTHAQADDDTDVFELSPFVVSETESIGYLATNTLAGTRIKSDISDIASSISVMTQEFMEDVASTDAEDLLVWAANTEVPGIGGNFAGVVQGGAATLEDDNARRRPQENSRVRGLAPADLTRQFFATNIPFDSYNTSSITINRGSNSILFGLGSPSGIIENSLKQARFVDGVEWDFRFDDEGSIRTVLDYNAEAIKDKLAVRLIGLYEDRKWKIDPAFERDKRIFGAMTYKPFGKGSNTTIRANFENGDIKANRPRLSPPVDALSAWWDPDFNDGAPYPDRRGSNGRPFIDPVGLTVPLSEAGYNVVLPDGTNVSKASYFNIGNFLKTPGIVFNSPTDRTATANLGNEPFITGDRTFSPGPGIPSFPVNQPSFATLRASALAMRVEGIPFNGFYQNKQLTDPSIFNFHELLLDGPNKSEWAGFDTYTVTLEQLFLDSNAGIEVTFDHQSYDDGWFADVDGGRGRFLYVDTNVSLQSGELNPNFGRPFITGVRSASERFVDRDTIRVQGFYKLDLQEMLDNNLLGKILGMHNLTGLYDKQTIDRYNVGYSGTAWGEERLNFINSGSRTNASRITQRDIGTQIYLGESFANAPSPVGWNIQNPKVPLEIRPTETALLFNENTQQFEFADLTTSLYPNDKDILTNGGSISEQEVESFAAVLQSFWFDNLIVSTLGYREDEATIWENTNPPFGPLGNRLVDPDNLAVPSTPTGTIKTDVFSYGAVLHVPESIMEKVPNITDLSFHYSESENFIPSPGRVNIAGQLLPPEGGSTTEQGFSMELFGGKVYFKANWYETSQSNVTQDGLPITEVFRFEALFAERAPGIIANEAELRQLPLFQDAQPFSNFRNYVDPDTLLPIGYTTEFANFLGANPVDADNDGYPDDGSISILSPPGGLVGTTNVVSEGFEFETVMNPTPNWRIMFNIVQQEVIRSNTAPELAALIASRAAIIEQFADLPQAETGDENIGGRWNRTAAVPIKTILAQDGSPLVNEIREWRWNLATNYSFTEGPLKGFSVGGGVRWQDDIAIGYGVKNDPELGETVDTDNPIYGPTETDIDLWFSYATKIMDGKVDWKIQLNIRNLTSNDDLIPTFANPNGVVAGWRIRQPRTFIITNSFRF